MRNLLYIAIISIFVSLASSCQKVDEVIPVQDNNSLTTNAANRSNILTAPANFKVSTISNQDVTLTWDSEEGEEGYLLEVYSNDGILISQHHIDTSGVHQYKVNQGEGSFKFLIKRDCGGGITSIPAETAATACCGGPIIVSEEIDAIIQNGQSTCVSNAAVEAYTLNSTQSITQLTHTIYSASPDYLVIYGFTNEQNGTPTTYNMIPMSNILTVNAATSMNHTLQLDFQDYSYCKVYFIPWNLNNCSVL